MNHIPEKTYLAFFRWGILVKALIGAGELLSGCALLFLSYDRIYTIIFTLFGNELNEDPKDIFSTYTLRAFKDFSLTPKSVWIFILLSHGIVKLFLISGLLRNKLWAYPASAIVFGLFVLYQTYQLTYAPSILLGLITLFDIIVIGLILHEYQYKKQRGFIQ